MLSAFIPVAINEMLQQTWLAAVPTAWLNFVTASLLTISLIELGLRAGLRLAALPVPPSNSIGALLAGSRQQSGTFFERIHQNTGVDLTASWAIRFSVRAAPICLLVLIFMMWLISSISLCLPTNAGF